MPDVNSAYQNGIRPTRSVDHYHMRADASWIRLKKLQVRFDLGITIAWPGTPDFADFFEFADSPQNSNRRFTVHRCSFLRLFGEAETQGMLLRRIPKEVP
jgi:hypothetical protein